MRARCCAYILGLVFAPFVIPANAAVIFQEDFSGATPGANNSLAGTKFTVTSAAVDIVGVLNGSFFTCVNNPGGNCLDLVGSPGLGSISSIPTLNLSAGDKYTITFGYVFQSPTAGSSDFTVGLGSFSDVLTAVPTVQDASLSFIPGSNETGVHLTFATDTSPDDFHGAILDHIVVAETPSTPAVPEPSTWAMMLIGFAGLGFLAWRGQKSATNAA